MKEGLFIFHGTGGHPGENWFPWLKQELAKEGYDATIPQFPTPEGQSLEAWLKVLKEYESSIQGNTVLIGHSLGGLFLLRLLERLKEPVKAVFLVSAPIGVKPIKNWGGDYAFSDGFNFDWEAIKSNAGTSTVYHSKNQVIYFFMEKLEVVRH